LLELNYSEQSNSAQDKFCEMSKYFCVAREGLLASRYVAHAQILDRATAASGKYRNRWSTLAA
jgi:hypothetical protein